MPKVGVATTKDESAICFTICELVCAGCWAQARADVEVLVADGSPTRSTQGVAAAEVELDTLTGDHTVLRVDIKMDVGKSLNPAIDYGQM